MPEDLKSIPTKRQIKADFTRGEIGFSDAIPPLMFDHGMDQGEAFRYLMESPRGKRPDTKDDFSGH